MEVDDAFVSPDEVFFRAAAVLCRILAGDVLAFFCSHCRNSLSVREYRRRVCGWDLVLAVSGCGDSENISRDFVTWATSYKCLDIVWRMAQA